MKKITEKPIELQGLGKQLKNGSKIMIFEHENWILINFENPEHVDTKIRLSKQAAYALAELLWSAVISKEI